MRVRTPLQILPVVTANVILFVALHPLFRGDVTALALIPVGAVGSAYGALPGIGAALAAILAHTILFNLLGTPGWDAIVRENAVLGSVVVVAVGALSGSVHDLYRALSRANSRLAAESERLQLDLTSREEYMSVLAYELRNPLVGIRAASRVLAVRLTGQDRTMGEAIATETARGLSSS
ncbi:MAG: HAMP domain-containing histidine kinase [Chloroflexi bacterium]|nr:HAMP domain-containing histidine kinase [Chloroflexota bacterium]